MTKNMAEQKQLYIRKRLADCAFDNRYRIGFAVVMAYIAGVIFYMNYDVQVFGMPLPIFTGLIYGVVVGPAAYLTCLFLPAFTTLIETTAVSRLFLAIGVANYPETGKNIMASPVATATIVVGGAILLRMFLSSRMAENLHTGLATRLHPN